MNVDTRDCESHVIFLYEFIALCGQCAMLLPDGTNLIAIMPWKDCKLQCDFCGIQFTQKGE